MCLDLEAGHDSDQSQNFSEDGNLDAVLRENLDPATDAGNRCENYSSDENRTRRRRVSKRSRKTLSKSDDDDDVNEENKDTSLSLEMKTCELCSKKFQNSHAFTLHLKEHNSNSNRNNGNAFVCTLCNKPLSSKSSLDRHALVHSGYKPHKCGICGVLFTTNGNMNRHIRTHDEKKRKCVLKKHACVEGCRCTYQDLYQTEFSSGKFPLIARIACEKQRRCAPPAFKKIKLENECSDQELAELIRVYMCDRCNRCFPCQRSLFLHNQDCLECESCEVQFSNNSQFENHVQNHDERNEKLPLIDSIKKEENIVRQEKLKDHGVDENNVPGKEMNIGNNFNEKEQNIYDEESKKRNIEDCKKDEEEEKKALFFYSLGLAPARKLNSPKEKEIEQKEPEESPQSSDDISCHGELVIDESVNSNNAQSNDDDGSCSDSKCSSLSSSPEKISPDKNDAPENRNEISPLSDEKISKSLPLNSSNEILKSLADFEGKFQCKQCSATFSNKKSLKTHSKDHSQLKMYNCDECSYKSTDKSTLQRHMRTHNGVKPYKCKICNFAFTTKTNAQRHIRKKHHIPRGEDEKYAVYNIEKPESNSSAIIANENPSETTCKYCQTYFGNSRMLKHHLRSVKDCCTCKPYVCKKCGNGFSTKNNCTRHINKTHPEYKTKVKELLVYNRPNSNGHLEQTMNIVDDDTKSDSQQGNSENGDFVMQVDSEGNQDLENSDANIYSGTEDDRKEEKNDEDTNFGFNSQKDGEELHVPERLVLPEYPGYHRELPNTSDEVSAVDGLMSLSKSVPFQEEPLDLSVRPIDLSSKETLSPNNANAFSCSLSTSREQFQNPVSVNLSISTMHSPKAQSTPLRKNLLRLRSLAPSEFMSQNLNLVSNVPASVPEGQIPTPVDYSLSSKSLSSSEMNTTVPDKKLIPCNYCPKKFTLKSNKERHIKNHHPERARPPRSRNFIPMFQGASIQKQTPNVSDVTKDRLRSVLMPKVCNGSGLNEADMNIDGETLSVVIEKKETIPEISNKNIVVDGYLKHGSKNDYENNDLASVSSVINTVNSKEINRFLKDASLTDTQTSPEEKLNSPENATGESNGSICSKDKQFKCEYCGRAFNYSSARERHMATHTGEKPYFCSKCNSRFSTKSNRDRHEKKSCCEKTNYRYKPFSNPLKDSTKSHENVLTQIKPNEAANHTDSKRTDFLSVILDNQRSNSSANAFFPHGILNNSFQGLEHSNSLSTCAVNTSVPVLNLEYSCPTQNLECKFCNNTYKNNNDLTNHMKELHPLEYKSLIGETFNPEDTIQSWKKNSSGKRKTV